jgi:acyl-coenzyme A thioesterase PaaI-like protein
MVQPRLRPGDARVHGVDGVQYVAAASTSDIPCRAQTVRRARELIFSEIAASDSSGKVLAHALQTYRIA